MIKNQSQKFEEIIPYVLLVLCCLIAFWPLTFNIFSLKNDAVLYFLPWRYHISESIQNGYFPFWNPYLYTGIPIHSDIQSGVWNPVVLLISCFTTYNMSVLQWETLFYISVAAVGFYKLCKWFNFETLFSFTLAIAYSCSGYIIDSCSFIPWVTSAAYVPFVFLYFLRLCSTPGWVASLKFALSIFLLFTAGNPTFFIYSFYIFLLLFLVFLIKHLVVKKKDNFKKICKYISIAAFLSLILTAPALISFIEFLPYYSRGSGASLEQANFNPFHIKNTVSYLLPQVSYKLETGNDITARNAYLGIFSIIFLLLSLKIKWKKIQVLILGITIFSFLFSLGKATPIRDISYYLLPLMDSFRHPGSIRLFTTIGLLLLAGFGMQYYQNNYRNKPATKTLYITLSIFIFILIIALFNSSFLNNNTLLTKLSVSDIKLFLDQSTAADWTVINSILQITFISATIAIRKINYKMIFYLSICNVIIFTILSAPFTLISQYSTSQVNSFIKSFQKGYPTQNLNKPVKNVVEDKKALTLHGYEDFYSKSISIQDQIVTPTLNKSYTEFLHNHTLRNAISKDPVLFTNHSDNIIVINQFTPNSINIEVDASQPTELHFIQQYNHNWKAYVNGERTSIKKSHGAFIGIAIPSGKAAIKFKYENKKVALAAFISLFFLATIFISLILLQIRKKKVSLDQLTI